MNDAAALMLVRGTDFLSVFEKPQRDALAMLFLRVHRQEIVAAEILWGLWLLSVLRGYGRPVAPPPQALRWFDPSPEKNFTTAGRSSSLVTGTHVWSGA